MLVVCLEVGFFKLFFCLCGLLSEIVVDSECVVVNSEFRFVVRLISDDDSDFG